MFDADDTPIEGKGEEMLPARGLPFQEKDAAQGEASGSDSDKTAGGTDFVTEDEVRSREAELAEDFSTQFRPTMDTESLEEDVGFASARVPIELPASDKEAIRMESGADFLRDEEFDDLNDPNIPNIEDDPNVPAFDPAANMPDLADPNIPPVEEAPPPGMDGGGGAGFEVPEREFESPPVRPPEEVAVPPPASRRGMPLFSEDAFAPPGPVSAEESTPPPKVVGDLKASSRLLGMLVTDERIKKLWERGDVLQQEVIEKIEDVNLGRSLLDLIRSAKTQMMVGKGNFEEAERAINEVAFRVSQREKARQWTRAGNALFFYELLWAIVLILAFYLVYFSGVFSINLSGQTIFSENEIVIAIGGALAGGIGGVAGALYALWRYVTSRTFNPQYRLWYITQPVLGLLIGMFVFLFVKVGFNVTAGSVTVEIGSPWIIFLLSFVGGFQQNVLLNIIKQVLKLFQLGGDEEES